MDMASEFCHGKKNGGFTATVLLCKTSYTVYTQYFKLAIQMF